MICGLVVVKIYKYELRLYLRNLLRICKMGITFAYKLGWKSFLYEKSSTRKVTSEFNGVTPLNIFKILKNLTEKSYGALKIWWQKNSNLLVALCLPGAPLVTKKIVLNFFSGIFFQNMIRNMNGSLKYFFKISSHSWTWTKS